QADRTDRLRMPPDPSSSWGLSPSGLRRRAPFVALICTGWKTVQELSKSVSRLPLISSLWAAGGGAIGVDLLRFNDSRPTGLGAPPYPLPLSFLSFFPHQPRGDQGREPRELSKTVCCLSPLPQRPPFRPVRRHRTIDPFGELDIHRIDQDPPDEETDGEHRRGRHREGDSVRAVAAEQECEHDERDDGDDLHKHAERNGQRVEPALHRGADPEILVPSHARRQLHEMAETEAERERGKHDDRETKQTEFDGSPLSANYSFALPSGVSSSAMLKRRTV